MAAKIYKFITGSYGYKATLPSGIDTLSGVQNIRMKIKKPDGTIIMKNMVAADIVAGTKNVQVLISNGDFDQEGIYDYEMADTTSGQDRKGELLQFSIVREIT